MSRACQNDGSFGPAIGPCRGGFDFTLAFEDSMLGLLPQAALLLFAPIRLATLRRRRDRVAKHSHLGFLKTVTSVSYAASSVVLLAIWCETESFKTKLSIASASLEFLGSLLIVTLSRLEHSRAVRPSHLLQFFLLVLLLCDAVRLRTLFLMDYPTSLVTPASIHTFLTGLLLLLESLDKRELFYHDRDRRLPPEATIGLFGKRLFWYLNGLFREGYGKILKPADLFNIDADLASKARSNAFQEAWMKQDKTKGAALARTILRVLKWDLIAPIIPRLLQMSTTLSQPYLITAMISFIEKRDKPDTKNTGYGLIAAFAMNYTVLAIASSWCAQNVARFSTKLRGCLISLIYEKTLHSSPKDADLGVATVLMNVDVEQLLGGCRQMNEIWAAFISTSVALFILYTHLGAAFVAPFLTILITTGISAWIGKHMRARQLLWAAATQKRVTTVSYVVGCMKGIRMLGLSQMVFRMLTTLREIEVAAHRHIRKVLVWVLLISNAIFQLTTLTTYVTFAVIMLTKSGGMSLDFNKLYGSLSALKLATSPLMIVLQLIPTLQTSLASLERIEKYLKNGSTEKGDFSSSDALPAVDGSELTAIPVKHRRGTVISLSAADFAIGDQVLLFDLTTRIRPGLFTMVIGKVGSGKSVFLRSLIGETKLCSGSFTSPTSGIAFCDQAVWLRNASVRENIVGEDDFEEAWYSRILWACGLSQDLAAMKKGDQTAIGSKGISLSGGQKNRISLARALYARKPVLAVDDMLAGLDNATEKLVFDRVFGRNGVLRNSNATVILATHSTYYARHADNILVLSEGRIVKEGTYEELLNSNIDLHAFCGATGNRIDENDSSHEVDMTPTDSIEVISPVLVAEIKDNDEEDAARQSGDRRSLMFFMKAVGTLHVSLYWALLAVAVAVTQVQFVYLKIWAASDDPSRSATIRHLCIFILVTLVNILVYFIWMAHYALWFTPALSLRLHASQLVALIRAEFSWIVSTDIGNITNRFSQDIVLVDNQLQNAWINVTSEFLMVVSVCALIIIATPPIAAIVPLLAGVGYCIQRIYLRTSRQVRLMDLEAKAPLVTHFLESLAGIVTIRAFSWLSAYRTKNAAYLDQSQVPFYLLFAIQNWLNLVLELMVAGLITTICGLAVGLRSKVDPGYLGLALVSAMDLGWNFRMIILNWTELETSLSAVTRIRQFTMVTSERQDGNRITDLGHWPMHGSVAFKDFSASYTDGGKSVLKDINLSIRAGEKIGLCGWTGSGKSSLVATLFGLLHQQSGEILVDDVPTMDVSLSVLRSKIIALPQEPFFLRGTVRHNLAPWSPDEGRSPVSDQQMEEALRQVQLWDKLGAALTSQETALDVSLDDVDSLLSQGEKQLFCLARAILMDGKIVVLDEATSSVDSQTDALMQRILRSAFADRTIIAIAHRLDTILDFDRVIVMDAGKIAEVGEPSTLLKTQGSLFKALVESQGRK